MRRILVIPASLIAFSGLALMALPHTTGAQGRTNSLNDIYRDESHCLTSPEIRSDMDNPMSCYCRDAMVDALYLYSTYVSVASSHPDPNMTGPFLALQSRAGEMCSRNTNERLSLDFIGKIQHDTTTKDWKWNGPEVVRTYPPDDVLQQIKPDNGGMIHYQYSVVLLQRESSGRVVKTESFTAKDAVPLAFLKSGSTERSKPTGTR